MSDPQLPFVKYQILSCQGRDILVGLDGCFHILAPFLISFSYQVGRLKIATPTVRHLSLVPISDIYLSSGFRPCLHPPQV